MAENRATFSLRRRFALGFSKRRLSRTALRVPSRSIFFFNRRNARSTGSPFFNLISVKSIHFLSKTDPGGTAFMAGSPLGSGRREYFRAKKSQSARKRSKGGENHECRNCHLNPSPPREFFTKPLAFRPQSSIVLPWNYLGNQ